MIIEKDTKIGKIKVEVPVDYNDVIVQGTHYPINRIIVIADTVYVANTSSGLWVKIEDLELINEKKGIKYFKIKKEE